MSEKIVNKEKDPKRTASIAKFFQNKEDGLEYKSINMIIKLVGVLVAITLFLFILQSVGESVFQPIFTFLKILSPFIVGIVFAWLLTPVESALVARDMKPTTAAFIVTIVGVFLLIILFGGFAYVTFSSIVRFFTGGYDLDYFMSTGTDVISTINHHMTMEASNGGLLQIVVQGGVVTGAIEAVKSNGTTTYELVLGSEISISDIISTSASYFYKFVISAVVVGFMLPNFSSFGNSIKSIIPKNVKEEWSNFIDIISASFTDYMRGALMIAGIVGSVFAIGISIVSVLSSTIFHNPGHESILTFALNGNGIFTVLVTVLVFGILGAITNLIPYAGPFIGGVPIVVLVLLNDNTPMYWVSWAVAAVIIVTQSLETLFLQPVVMGRATKMHPVAILLGLTVFGSLFGIVGMIISTPILSVGRSVINYYNDKYDIF